MGQEGDRDTTREWARLWAWRALAYGLDERDHFGMFRVERMLGPEAKDRLDGPGREEFIVAGLDAAEASLPKRCGVFFDNLEMLQSEFGLTSVQADVIALRSIASLERGLEDAMDDCSRGMRFSTDMLARHLAVVLAAPETEIREALDPKGPMASRGLVCLSDQLGSFRERLGLTMGMVNALMRKHDSIDSLLEFALVPASPATLGREDFEHLAPQLDLAIGIIREAQRSHRPGAGILLHGLPGTGKTEMARLIARECDLALYVVDDMVEEGGGRARLNRLKFLQGICSGRRKALILFDEAEDIWPRKAGFGGHESESTDKGGLVNLLESLRAPVIWVTNAVTQIDHAFLRRFDMVLEVRPPPRRSREKILREAMPELEAPKGSVERLVEDCAVTPGVIARYAGALQSAGLERGPDALGHLESMVGEWLRATGRRLPPRSPRGLDFDLTLANASLDLSDLARRICTAGRGRVLMHGIPGTGKTEFAHYLARVGDLPITVRHASDLLSKYWGETERNLADMFDEARHERSVLVLDEADSFLRDRGSARYGWEKTQVNELLAQMEDFDGVFLCSTNLMEEIDRAAMRRFHFKVEFGAMTLEQRCRLLERITGVSSLSPATRHCLAELGDLTPGDFAAITSGLEIVGSERSVEAVLEGLRQEVAARVAPHRGIGFLRAV